jgi:hypothetical protein
MNFSIVIGNPPYNNDINLQFVILGNNLSTRYSLWITPAKWQSKGGLDNISFRRAIIPYISKLTYYIDCGDVFNIRIHVGIAYYLITKTKVTQTLIRNYCSRVKSFESQGYESRVLDPDKCFLGNNATYTICSKVGCFNKDFTQMRFGMIPVEDHYNVFASALVTDAVGKTSFHTFSNTGNLTMLAPLTISKEAFYRSNDTKCFFTSTEISKSKNFITLLNTKFIRFLLLMRNCTFHNNNDESWSFVPEYTDFTKEYTDKELYKEYGLTDAEIEIIESVIKSRV